MAALTIERSTQRMGTADGASSAFQYFPVKASTKIYKGAAVVLNGGYAAGATGATGLIALGRAEETVDNSSGSNGALSIKVRPGTYKFANLGGDPVVAANLGADCYLEDDNTIRQTSNTNTRSRAGKSVQIDSDGVWVQMGLGL